MTDNAVDGPKCIAVRHTFNDIEILSLEYKGRMVLLPHQVGESLGYAEPRDVSRNALGKWSDDLLELEGENAFKLEGEELAAFKAGVNQGPDRPLVDPRASHLILLTESGAQLVAMLSRTPRARAFRRWLVDVVIPEWKARKLAPPTPLLPDLQVEAVTERMRELLSLRLKEMDTLTVVEMAEAELQLGRKLESARRVLTWDQSGWERMATPDKADPTALAVLPPTDRLDAVKQRLLELEALKCRIPPMTSVELVTAELDLGRRLPRLRAALHGRKFDEEAAKRARRAEEERAHMVKVEASIVAQKEWRAEQKAEKLEKAKAEKAEKAAAAKAEKAGSR